MTFQFLTAASIKTTIFWNIVPSSPVESDIRFRGAYYLSHRSDDEGVLRDHTPPYPTRQKSSI
jgi:hypothetical protein